MAPCPGALSRSDGCDGTPPCGQDAQYANLSWYSAPRTFTTKNTGGGFVVIDQVSDYRWQRDIDGQNRIQPTSLDYCTSLSYGGSSSGSWRLPDIYELETIQDFGAAPSLPAMFLEFIGTPPVVASSYWSATTVLNNDAVGWCADFTVGSVFTQSTATSAYVRCILASSAPNPRLRDPSNRFVPAESGAVFVDRATGLSWQVSVTKGLNWGGALGYCENTAQTAGYLDWRLPNANEMRSLVDFFRGSPSPATVFPNLPAMDFWTSTTDVNSPASAWAVNMSDGTVHPQVKSTTTNGIGILCVRGGS